MQFIFLVTIRFYIQLLFYVLTRHLKIIQHNGLRKPVSTRLFMKKRKQDTTLNMI